MDECLVPLGIGPLQITQQPSPLPDKLHQTTARMVVVLMLAQVLCENVDAFRQKGHLDLCRSGVLFVLAELLDNRGFLRLIQRHRFANPPIAVRSLRHTSTTPAV